MKEGKIRKFAYKEQRTDRQTNKHRIQTLRPLYPLWILEGDGQFAYKQTKNRQTDMEFKH